MTVIISLRISNRDLTSKEQDYYEKMLSIRYIKFIEKPVIVNDRINPMYVLCKYKNGEIDAVFFEFSKEDTKSYLDYFNYDFEKILLYTVPVYVCLRFSASITTNSTKQIW